MTLVNRTDAGRQLAAALRSLARSSVVVGLARGGVPVAAEVARELGVELEICVVRKLVLPGDPPITIGAVAEGRTSYIDEASLAGRSIEPAEIDRLVAREAAVVTRLAQMMRDGPPLDVRGRDVIVVDDGVVTGGTIHAAVRSLRARRAGRIVLAAPAANARALQELRGEIDRFVTLEVEPLLVAIGSRYLEFNPVSEAEVAGLLAAARRPERAAAAVL